MKRLPSIWLICLLAAQHSAAEEIDSQTMQRLVAGEAVLLDSDSSQTGGSARVQIISHSSARAYWEAVLSCKLAFIYVEGMEKCEVLEESEHRDLVHQVVDRGWHMPAQDFTFESRYDPYREIRFHLVEGNLKEMEGSWQFTEIPEGVIVDYRIHITPALPVPRFLVRHSIRKDMPDLVACIRGLARGSFSEAGRQEDLARCPGENAGR